MEAQRTRALSTYPNPPAFGGHKGHHLAADFPLSVSGQNFICRAAVCGPGQNTYLHSTITHYPFPCTGESSKSTAMSQPKVASCQRTNLDLLAAPQKVPLFQMVIKSMYFGGYQLL